jgi:phosphotransferase system  glucose/maltose/N-acetylglucosamine-specific IIC component
MVQNVIDTIVDVITGLLSGIGSGIVEYFEAVFLNSTQDGLNSVGTFIFVLLGIGAAFGLAGLVFNMVRRRA